MTPRKPSKIFKKEFERCKISAVYIYEPRITS